MGEHSLSLNFAANHGSEPSRGSQKKDGYFRNRLFSTKSADGGRNPTFVGWNRCAKKSCFAGIGAADLISSEAVGWRFHPSLLGFHRARHDFIEKWVALLYYEPKKSAHASVRFFTSYLLLFHSCLIVRVRIFWSNSEEVSILCSAQMYWQPHVLMLK